MRPIIILSLLLTICFTTSAQINYTATWKKIDTMILNRGLNASALKEVNALYKKAAAESNDAQKIKALLYRIQLQEETDEESSIHAILALEKETAAETGASKAILQSLTAEAYWQYLQENQWELRTRTSINATPGKDISDWSIDQLHAKISALFDASLNPKSMLQKTSLNHYEPLIIKGNSRKLRPTLFDLLAYRALNYFRNDSRFITKPALAFELTDPALFAEAKQFAAYPFKTVDTLSPAFRSIRIYQSVIQYHLNSGNLAALADADIERIGYVEANGTMQGKESLYIQALQRAMQEYRAVKEGRQADYLLAAYYAGLGAQFRPGVDTSNRYAYAKSVEVLQNILKDTLASEGRANAQNLYTEITRPSLTITSEQVNSANLPFRLLVTFKNLNGFYGRIIPLNNELQSQFDHYWSDEFWKIITSQQSIRNINQAFPSLSDHQPHHTEIKIDALTSGRYVLLASTENNFAPGKQTQLSALVFQVSNIAYFNKGNDHFVVDRENGKPLGGAQVNELNRIFIEKTRNYENRIVASYTTDQRGIFRTQKPKQNNYDQKTFVIKLKNDSVMVNKEPDYFTYEEEKSGTDEVEDMQSFLFTDRSIYRPGQIVYFKGIMTTKEKRSGKSKVVAGQETTIFLYDANDEEIDSVLVKSNEFGSYNGRFTLPYNLLNGNFRIEDDETLAEVNFSVEEYKRPKFKTELQKPSKTFKVNDSIFVSGITTAFAGNSISNAKVNYRIVRRAQWPIWGAIYGRKIFPYPGQQQQEIAHGNTTTDAGGNFSIAFKAIPDLKIDTAFNPVFSYTVSVDVSDINGETHSASEIIQAGYRSFQLNAITREEINANEPLEVSIGITNMNDIPVNATVKINLQQLETPERVTRERYWERPDVFVLNENEYRKAFPTDVYANEDDPLTWKSNAVIQSITDTARGTRKFTLSNNASPGNYLLTITANKNGEQIQSKQVIRVTGSNANGDAYAKIIAKDTVTGSVTDYTIETNLPGLMITSQELQPDTAKAYQQKSVKGLFKENIQVVSMVSRIDMAGVYNNRYYADSKEIRKIEAGTDLKIEIQSFRNKTMPGSNEQWTLKVTGKDKQPVELATVMYDASLDMVRNHEWSLPQVGGSTNINAPIFKKGSDFNSLVSANRTFNEPVYASFEKTYDQLRFDPLSEGRNRIFIRGMASSPEKRLQGKAAGIAVQNADAKMEEVVVVGYGNETTMKSITSTSVVKSSSAITPRKDMRETAFFYPSLQPKPDGSIEINFTMPEALTSWKWMSMAHDKQLNFGYLEKMIQTQKPLMVQPNMPRFLREGDRLNLSAKIVNMSEKELTGQVELQLIDPETNQPVDGWFRNFFPNQYFTAAAGESVVSDFSIEVPFQYAKPVITRLFVRSDSLTDGEENMIPVLINKQLVTETLPVYTNGDEVKKWKFTKLMNSDSSETLTHKGVTVEYTSNPSWYVLQALPYMSQITHGCADEIFTRLYANSVTNYLVQQNPSLKQKFAALKNDTSLTSKLQQNEELKNILLQQTPWVLEAKNETAQMQQIASLFADSIRSTKDIIEQLKSYQNDDGGFSWFKGGRSDRYITQKILIGLGRLNEFKMDASEELEEITDDALSFAHDRLLKDYNDLMKSKTKTPSISYPQVQYLYMLGYFKDEPIKGDMLKAINYYRKQLTTKWTIFNKYGQAMAALSLHASGDNFNASKILRSMQETAITHPEMGMYWKDMVSGYYWYQSPVQSQSMMIELFTKMKAPAKQINALKTWLIKNKQTNNWGNNIATADAAHAILLNNQALTGPAPIATITLGNQAFSNRTDSSYYFKRSIDAQNVRPSMGEVKLEVSGSHAQPTWGSVYWQYFEDINKITASGNALKVNKELFITKNTGKGPVLERLTEGNIIKVGDKITVRVQLQSDRNMEYVHLRDMRASSMEPLQAISGWRYNGGLGFYQSTKDASTDFYFDFLPKGKYVFEYQLNATIAGTFSNGITTVESMYAPEFKSHTAGSTIMVEKE